ncbi:MAG: hypothetical protein IJB27_03625 [Clostridia bacterium]|nr:hypothetical protein [Clostridia bacterium]
MKQIGKAIAFDIRFGILSKWLLFLPALLWGLFMALCVDTSCMAGKEMGVLSPSEGFTLGDVALYAFHGGALYLMLPAIGIWQIPVRWLLWHVYIALIVSLYPFKNLCGIGQQMLIRFRHRTHWWIGKCVWCVVSVVLAYAAMFLGMFLYTAVRGQLLPTFSFWMADVIACPILPTHADISVATFSCLLLLTTLSSIALCQWQTALMLWLHPFGAFFVVVVLLTVTSFFDMPFMAPKYTIWIDSVFLGIGTAEPAIGAIVCTCTFVSAVLLGGLLFSKFDIINVQE